MHDLEKKLHDLANQAEQSGAVLVAKRLREIATEAHNYIPDPSPSGLQKSLDDFNTLGRMIDVLKPKGDNQ